MNYELVDSIGTVLCLVKDQYGRAAYHPHNDTARHLASIAGTKTLTEHTLRHALAMGFSVHYIHPWMLDHEGTEMTPSRLNPTTRRVPA